MTLSLNTSFTRYKSIASLYWRSPKYFSSILKTSYLSLIEVVRSGSADSFTGFFKANDTNPLTSSLRVALNIKVYRLGLMLLHSSAISISKPNSNNLSASSNTNTSILSRSMF